MTPEDIIAIFPNNAHDIRTTSSGVEVVLRDCPFDLRNKGPGHPKWKVFANPDKETVRCFVCHPPGEGESLRLLSRRRKTRSKSKILKDMRQGVKVMPAIPPTRDLRNLPGLHPAHLYLQGRGIAPSVAVAAGVMWKDEGVPAWIKEDKGRKKEVGKYPALILPLITRGTLVGWQLAAVPRLDKVPKYVTAPGSKLAGCLFNYDNVVGQSRIAVVVEGVFDALRIPEYGCAVLTDRVNAQKRRLLSSGGFEEIILCLDSDRTEEHVNDYLKVLLGAAPKVRAVHLEHGDPADYSKRDLLSILGVSS